MLTGCSLSFFSHFAYRRILYFLTGLRAKCVCIPFEEIYAFTTPYPHLGRGMEIDGWKRGYVKYEAPSRTHLH